MSPEKEELLRLQETGEFVFHGTGEEVLTLEPRQAVDTKTGPDGPPAVFASDQVDYAIFMAIVNKTNCPSGSQSRAGGTDDNGVIRLRFGMTNDTAAQLKDDAAGFVYVFPREAFVQRDFKAEFVSEKAVVPIKKIRVSKEDLPKDIELYD